MNLSARSLMILGFLSLPALGHATGGVWCDADDANLGFHFKAVQSRDGTGPWFDIDGNVEIKFGKLPKHLTKFKVKDENLTERWWGREGVLLQVQKYDPDPFVSTRLTVVTKPVDEGVYEGTYELRITADSGDEAYVTKEGKINCGGD